MSEAAARPPVKFKIDDAPAQDLEVEGRAVVTSVIGPKQSPTLGAGLAEFEDAEFEWKLEYDEVMFILEGRVSVEGEFGSVSAAEGEMVLVPKGNLVTYRFPGSCRLLYSTYPANWEEASGQ